MELSTLHHGANQYNSPLPGAAPVEVETICKRVEEKIQDLDGIKKLTSEAAENFGSVSIEVERGYNVTKLIERVPTELKLLVLFQN